MWRRALAKLLLVEAHIRLCNRRLGVMSSCPVTVNATGSAKPDYSRVFGSEVIREVKIPVA